MRLAKSPYRKPNFSPKIAENPCFRPTAAQYIHGEYHFFRSLVWLRSRRRQRHGKTTDKETVPAACYDENRLSEKDELKRQRAEYKGGKSMTGNTYPFDAAPVVRRILAGDEDAYTEIVEAYQARLRAHLSWYAPNANLVDDVAQEAFVTAFRRLRHFRPELDFYPWLRQIAFNIMRTELRKACRRNKMHERYADLAVSSEMEQRAKTADHDEDLRLFLSQCLERFGEKAKKILELKYVQGLTMEEMSTRLSKDFDSLRGIVFRLRKKVRNCIETKLATAKAAESRGSSALGDTDEGASR